MGIRQSAQIKTSQFQITQKKISLADFTLKQALEHFSPGQIYNWIVEQEGNTELSIMKIIPKLQLYNDKMIKAYIKQLFLMVSLPHPFLIEPYYAFQDLNNLYLVLEYIPGGDLRSQLKQQIMNENQAKILIAQVLVILEFLHNHQIIHTNLSPNNIFLHSEGFIKLYGLHSACKAGDFKIEDELTEYLAPEVLLREEFGAEADFYSLGVILYEIMAQKRLYQDQEQEDLIEFIRDKQIQVKKSELSEGWSLDAADFINKLIQKNPKNRLGYYGIQDIKSHNWLQGIIWTKIEDKSTVNSSFIPKVQPQINQPQKFIHQISHPMVEQQEFQNLFSLFHYRWDEEVKEIDYAKFL